MIKKYLVLKQTFVAESCLGKLFLDPIELFLVDSQLLKLSLKCPDDAVFLVKGGCEVFRSDSEGRFASFARNAHSSNFRIILIAFYRI